MNKEQMIKYGYELMIKNNPEEVIKNLILKDKLQEENQRLKQFYDKKGVYSLEYDKETLSTMICKLQERIDKGVEYLEKAQEGLEEWHFDGYDPNLLEVINILKGEDNE